MKLPKGLLSLGLVFILVVAGFLFFVSSKSLACKSFVLYPKTPKGCAVDLEVQADEVHVHYHGFSYQQSRLKELIGSQTMLNALSLGEDQNANWLKITLYEGGGVWIKVCLERDGMINSISHTLLSKADSLFYGIFYQEHCGKVLAEDKSTYRTFSVIDTPEVVPLIHTNDKQRMVWCILIGLILFISIVFFRQARNVD